MNVNRLYVKPTLDTLSYLSSVFSGNPLEIDLESLRVEIMITQDELEIDPARIYEAQAYNVNIFYDTGVEMSSLICTLVSADLQARAAELNAEGVLREFTDWYIPYIVLKRPMPPLSSHYRTARVQIANALCTADRPLFFTGEYVEQQDVTWPPDADYQRDMAAELQFRHNV